MPLHGVVLHHPHLPTSHACVGELMSDVLMIHALDAVVQMAIFMQGIRLARCSSLITLMQGLSCCLHVVWCGECTVLSRGAIVHPCSAPAFLIL
jgi:hypothetical protein